MDTSSVSSVQDDDALARWWGLLNRMREDAAAAYGAEAPDERRPTVAQLVVGIIVLCGGIAAGVSIGGGSGLARGEGVLAGLVLLVSLGLVGTGAFTLYGAARRFQARGTYRRRSEERDRLRHRLEALAASWGGTVSADGVTPAVRFLVERWPDAAPQILMIRQGLEGESEQRFTLTTTVDGCPVLVHVVDFVPTGGAGVRPPAVVVLAACALGPSPVQALPGDSPFRGPATGRPESEPEAAWLAAHDFSVALTCGGAHAVQSGPAGSLLDEPTLARAARALVTRCRSAPSPRAGLFIPARASTPELEVDEGPREIVVGFLSALRDRDASRLLARAHFLLFADQETEPTPAWIQERLRVSRGRPLAWDDFGVLPSAKEAGGSGIIKHGKLDVELAGEVTTYGVQGEVEGRGRTRMRVSLLRVPGRRRCVSGYDVTEDAGPGGIMRPEPVFGVIPSCER